MNGATPLLLKWLDKSIGPSPLYLVGGTVRDLLMYGVPKDLDLVCKNARGLALSIARQKNAAFVPMEKKPDEPCYRIVDREENGIFLDIAEMKGESIEEDLSRRDFTINSLAMKINRDGSLGELIDPLKGAEDIKRKVVRITSESSLVSDPLRILRAIRFSAVLSFTIERSTMGDMRKSAPLLGRVSAERTMAEILLILKSSGSFHFFRQLDDLGILEVIFPEITPMKGCPQNGYHHKDVLEHSMLVMERCEHILNNLSEYFGDVGGDVEANLNGDNRLQFLKLTALLHDIGKPATRGIDADTGRITFYRHDEEGAKRISMIAERLKMSGMSKDFMMCLTAEHLNILQLASERVKATTIMKWFRKMGDDAVPAIILSMADVMAILGPDATEAYRQRHMDWSVRNIIDYYKRIKEKIESPNLISGDDLIALGMKPGPGIGGILSRIRTSQDAGEITSREGALKMAEKLINGKDVV